MWNPLSTWYARDYKVQNVYLMQSLFFHILSYNIFGAQGAPYVLLYICPNHRSAISYPCISGMSAMWKQAETLQRQYLTTVCHHTSRLHLLYLLCMRPGFYPTALHRFAALGKAAHAQLKWARAHPCDYLPLHAYCLMRHLWTARAQTAPLACE